MNKQDVALVATTYSNQSELFLTDSARVTWPRIRNWCVSMNRTDLYEELLRLSDSKPADYLQAFADNRLCLHCGTHPVGYKKSLQYCLDCLKLPKVKVAVREEISSRISSVRSDPAHQAEVRRRNLASTGFAHPMQNPEVRAVVEQTLMSRTGYSNPSYDPMVKKQRRATQRKNWGASHWLKSDSGKRKLAAINLERHGGHPCKTEKVKSKTRSTNAERYEGGHPLRDPQVVASLVKTNIRKYGAPCVLSNVEVREKMHETVLAKYGVHNAVQHASVKRKIKQTVLERTGYTHYSKDPEWFADNSGARHKRTEVQHCGRTLKLQGYEPAGLVILKRRYGARKVFASYEVEGRSVSYRFEGKSRTYHPDLTVVGEEGSVDFEVKSVYTLFSNLGMNRAKAKASGARTLVVLDPKTESHVLLPAFWWRLSQSALRKLVSG